jgi:hypothetical protein
MQKLAGKHGHRFGQDRDGGVQVRALEHDRGGLAAQLQPEALDVSGPGRGDRVPAVRVGGEQI